MMEGPHLRQALLLQHGVQLPNDDILGGDVKVAALLIVARPPVDAAGLIERRNRPAKQSSPYCIPRNASYQHVQELVSAASLSHALHV